MKVTVMTETFPITEDSVDNRKDLTEVRESGLSILVSVNNCSPKKTDLYYNKELRLERLLILNILAEYVKRGESVFKPVKCLDAGNGVGINGILWEKYVTEGIRTSIVTPNSTAVNTIKHNVTKNGCENINVFYKDVCSLLFEEPFNFINIDCHTEASHYFDAVFKHISRNGILIITTKDDSSLYGRMPDAALRNYGGVITKTSYGTELAIRLVIAAMARSASKYSKAIKVICCAAFKNAFMVAVKIIKGTQKVNRTFQHIKRLFHCSICEERAFYPHCDSYIIENAKTLLSCNCSSTYPGKIIMELGPVWAGEILDADYLRKMMKHSNIPSRKELNAFLEQLLAETMSEISQELEKSDQDEPPNKIMKMDDPNLCIEAFQDLFKVKTPPFYYNLPRHSPKGPRLIPIDKAIQLLKKSGYKSSRTHFDREAIRTSANAKQLMDVIQGFINNKK